MQKEMSFRYKNVGLEPPELCSIFAPHSFWLYSNGKLNWLREDYPLQQFSYGIEPGVGAFMPLPLLTQQGKWVWPEERGHGWDAGTSTHIFGSGFSSLQRLAVYIRVATMII